MDGILLILVLVLLAIPVGVIVSLVKISGQGQRIARLEDQMKSAERRLAELSGAASPPATDEEDKVEIVPPHPAPKAAVVPEPARAVIPTADAAAAPATPAAQVTSDAWARAASKAGEKPTRAAAGPSLGTRFAGWLRDNWVYVVSAASLAAAGLFLVQYGIENGLLPPPARVAIGIAFGLALIGGGEWLRRRFGDDEGASTAYLPSVFSGAGVVSVFAAVVAARQLYGLIGAETAFGGLMITAAGAVALGWFAAGPLLIVVGLLGAAASPFLVGGEGGGVWLYAHYVLVAAVGLAVDAVRRWRWLSGLTLILAYGGAGLLQVLGIELAGWLAFLTVLPVLTAILTGLRLVPDHAGPCPSLFVLGGGRETLAFGVPLVAAAVLASSLGLMWQGQAEPAMAMAAFAALAVLALVWLVWADRAPGLADLAALPAAAFLVALALTGADWSPIMGEFRNHDIDLRPPETGPDLTTTWLLALAAAVSLGAAYRSLREGPGILRLGFALGAVLVGPVAAAVLELTWAPAMVLGAYPWALEVIALAAAMVLLAGAFARADGEDHRRAAWATLSALSLIALSFFLILADEALTLALAALALVAAGLDRRFRLPEMGLFIQAAVAVLGFRLFVDPGLDWALWTTWGAFLTTFLGAGALLTAAWWVLRPMGRTLTEGVLESAVAGLAAITVNLVLARAMDARGLAEESHWALVLQGLPWLAMASAQIYRARLGGRLRPLRLGLAGLGAVLAAGALGLALTLGNPLFLRFPEEALLVRGPVLFDTLALAYLVPAVLMALLARRLPGLEAVPRARVVLKGLAAGLSLIWLGLEIRRFWRGTWLGMPGVSQPELYSYTVAMLVIGAGLLWQAIARGSAGLRRVAMGVIGLTAAKVFLLDASGLSGLTRVFSFLALGLTLAALAWLNRWAAARTARAEG